MARNPKTTKAPLKKKTAPPITDGPALKKKSVPPTSKDTKKGKEVNIDQAPSSAAAAAHITTPIATHHATPELATITDADHQAALQVMVEENRRLKERPSERKRNNPYDVAPLRKILGLHVEPEDPDYVKELKNETYNFLRETARDVIGDQELARTLDRGAHWDRLKEDKQKDLRREVSIFTLPNLAAAQIHPCQQFVRAVQNGGAFSLTFFTPPANGGLHKFAFDWPANELLKTVLRDQRVQMTNATSKLLYGNALFNEIHQQYNGSCGFPSEPVVRQAKTPKQKKLGRPRKDPLVQASLNISSESKQRLKVLEQSTRNSYRAMSSTPEFMFEPTGKVKMPAPRPATKAKKEKRIQDPSTDSHVPQTSTEDNLPATSRGFNDAHVAMPLDISINDFEKAYGGFETDAVDEQMMEVQGAEDGVEGEDLPLPDHDDDDNQAYDTDANHRDGSDSEMTESDSNESSSESDG
ncbi:hypothetical protein QFC21_001841 [Naganishia friedmannii]|uniref:Uncharacterized protein n=1 Tax=Naganishia friedmannii TaxID=89922 RepID=A0ACC2W2C8_9TREE|nr:hypothetical protein QFC21_001841 [Naganishia friedmannii]